MTADKTIGFAPNLVPLVLDGSKTLTYRLGNKWDFLQVGDKILTDNSGTGKVFAELEITHKKKELLALCATTAKDTKCTALLKKVAQLLRNTTNARLPTMRLLNHMYHYM